MNKPIEYIVFTLADEATPDQAFFVGVTSQHAKKRLSDLLAAVRGARGSSKMHLQIKKVMDAGREVLITVKQTHIVEQDARLAAVLLSEQLIIAGHPLVNKMLESGSPTYSGRPVGSRNKKVVTV